MKSGQRLVQKNQLGKGAFPKQKIGETLFAAGANQEIYFTVLPW